MEQIRDSGFPERGPFPDRACINIRKWVMQHTPPKIGRCNGHGLARPTNWLACLALLLFSEKIRTITTPNSRINQTSLIAMIAPVGWSRSVQGFAIVWDGEERAMGLRRDCFGCLLVTLDQQCKLKGAEYILNYQFPVSALLNTGSSIEEQYSVLYQMNLSSGWKRHCLAVIQTHMRTLGSCPLGTLWPLTNKICFC